KTKSKYPNPFSLRFTLHVSRFTFHASRFTFHASRFTFHVSRFTFHSSRLPLHQPSQPRFIRSRIPPQPPHHPLFPAIPLQPCLRRLLPKLHRPLTFLPPLRLIRTQLHSLLGCAPHPVQPRNLLPLQIPPRIKTPIPR